MVIGPKIYYFYPRFEYFVEYSNLLIIISKIRNTLYYYWFFIAHRSPNYCSPLSTRMVVTPDMNDGLARIELNCQAWVRMMV